MDLVYLLREGENEELRHSLRSVAENAKGLFANIWVVGTGLPDWLTNVNIIPIPDGPHKHETMRRKTLAACDHENVSQDFVLMNDDYFLMQPIKEWIVYHMGPCSEWVQGKVRDRRGLWSSYLRDVYKTAQWMRSQGFGDVLCRETHSATVWDKTRLAETIRKYPADRGLTVVELYDAAGSGGVGEFASNAKVHNDAHFDAKVAANDSPWLSSSDVSFVHSKIGDFVKQRFPDPCVYERGV